jgi:alpha-tubulin suppressor-like RCC1 family protein
VYCWGSNANGQLGDTTNTDHFTPVASTIGAVSDLAAGGSNTCAIETSTSRVKCWGWNQYGQVGDNSTTDRATPTYTSATAQFTFVRVGAQHACAKLTSGGGVRCWGNNDYGQVGDHTSTRDPNRATIGF